MDVSIIIVNLDGGEMFLRCIDSIYKTTKDISFEIIVIDNGSKDDSATKVIKQHPDINLIQNSKNIGFAKAVNMGFEIAQAKYICLLNNDTILVNNAIVELMNFLDKESRYGIAGCQLLDEVGSRQNSYDNIPTLATELLNKSLLRLLFPKKYPSKFQEHKEPIEVESVIGATLVIKRVVIDEIGKLDEDYFWSLEETDWCFRARQNGWKIYFVPQAKVIHLQGQTKKRWQGRARVEYTRSMFLFFKKNRGTCEYWILRLLMPFKTGFNLISSIVANIFTLFLKDKLREKSFVYAYLLLWQILLCPKGMGLNANSRN